MAAEMSKLLASRQNLIFKNKEAIILKPGGCSSTVEHQLPKLGVAGSIPVTRSNNFRVFKTLHAVAGFFVFVKHTCSHITGRIIG